MLEQGLTLNTSQLHRLAHRKALAAYNLRLWDLADKSIDYCETVGVEAAKWEPLRTMLKCRRLEAAGQFDIQKLITFSSNPVIANYTDAVEVRNTKDGRGRGLFMKRNVDVGEMIMVEQAAFDPLINPADDVTVKLFDVKTEPPTGHFAGEIAPYMLHQIIADPSLILTSDALEPHATRHSPVATEEERLEVIRRPLRGINIDHLVRKNNKNAYGLPREDGLLDSAVFPLISMINHSCIPNACSMPLNDVSLELFLVELTMTDNCQVQFVWAREKLTVGTEITLTYLDFGESLDERTDMCQTTWGFKCRCQLCLDDEKDDHAQRRELLSGYRWNSSPSDLSTKQALGSMSSTSEGRRMREMSHKSDSISTDAIQMSAIYRKVAATYKPGRSTPHHNLVKLLLAGRKMIPKGFPDGSLSSVKVSQ